MGRAPCCDKANVKKGPWSPEEDAKLKAYIEENGTGSNWIALPQKIGLKRCGKSCRLRWLNYLRPNIKHGSFSEEEDQIICSLYISIGSRWSIIAAQLPGRTDNDIKNYWNTRLKKKLLGRRREPQSQTRQLGPNSGPNETADFERFPPPPSQTLSSTALERMQLHLQLQGLHINHPSFSFYNHPALWPTKLHPLVGTTKLQQANEGSINDINTPLVPPLAQPSDVNVPCYPLPMSGNPNPNGFNDLEGELKELIYGKNNEVLSQLDCFQGMNGELGVEGLNWWDNSNGGFVVDEKSPSCSWDSGASSLHQADFSLLNQDYVLGYDM